MKTIVSTRSSGLSGVITLPGDKSISHRALILASLAEGPCSIYDILFAEDTLATLSALQALGVSIERSADSVTVQGVGLKGLRSSGHALDLQNSGTGLRLLAGVLSGQSFSTTLIGDASLSRRPMARIINPLREMGAVIEGSLENTLPLQIGPSPILKGIRYALPVASAQVKSCLLLAGLFAEGETTLLESHATRDHTERLLQYWGYPLSRHDGEVRLSGGSPLLSRSFRVPGDFSSAAFFIVAALLVPDSEIVLKSVGINPTRTGLIQVLKKMGAEISFEDLTSEGKEPVANIRVRSSRLKGIAVPPEWLPLMIDECPALCIAAAFAEGTTTLRQADELRYKESDRIEAIAQGLKSLGVSVQTLPDGLVIEGGGVSGGEVSSVGDHRIAMAFAIAGAAASSEVVVHDTACVATSFPGFVASAVGLGLAISEE